MLRLWLRVGVVFRFSVACCEPAERDPSADTVSFSCTASLPDLHTDKDLHHDDVSLRGPRARAKESTCLYARRTAGGDRHHRHARRPPAPGRAVGTGVGSTNELHQQPQAVRTGDVQLRKCSWLLPADRRADQQHRRLVAPRPAPAVCRGVGYQQSALFQSDSLYRFIRKSDTRRTVCGAVCKADPDAVVSE